MSAHAHSHELFVCFPELRVGTHTDAAKLTTLSKAERRTKVDSWKDFGNRPLLDTLNILQVL